MAVYNDWVVRVAGVDLDDVQQVTLSAGRRYPTDQWPVATATIRARFPTGFASPPAGLAIGATIRVNAPGRTAGQWYWTGNVQNVTYELGIPWATATSTGVADYIVIEAEGYAATIGRYDEFTYTPIGPQAVDVVMDDFKNNRGMNTGYPALTDMSTNPINWWQPPSPWTVQPLDLLQQMSIYTGGKIIDGIRGTWNGSTNGPAVWFADPYPVAPSGPGGTYIAPTSFSDTTNDATHRIYDEITFDGLADLYFTQATINDGDNDFTVSTGSAPYRTFYSQGPYNTSATYNAGYTAAAEDYANRYNPPSISIATISATTANQHTQNLDTLGLKDYAGGAVAQLGWLCTYIVPVEFRGATYYCQIEGVTVTADVDQSRFTYYVSPTSTDGWFRLNSTELGVLDVNRLGRY